MLERFQQELEAFKKSKEKELSTPSLELVENYFKMQDTNKLLKFNAINQAQVERTNRFEESLQKELKRLYVPDYQSKNI